MWVQCPFKGRHPLSLEPPRLSCQVLEQVFSPLSGPSTERSWQGSFQVCKDPASRHHEKDPRASLVAQWLRICLPMQGTRVRALVWEDPACRGANGPVSHNY